MAKYFPLPSPPAQPRKDNSNNESTPLNQFFKQIINIVVILLEVAFGVILVVSREGFPGCLSEGQHLDSIHAHEISYPQLPSQLVKLPLLLITGWGCRWGCRRMLVSIVIRRIKKQKQQEANKKQTKTTKIERRRAHRGPFL